MTAAPRAGASRRPPRCCRGSTSSVSANCPAGVASPYLTRSAPTSTASRRNKASFMCRICGLKASFIYAHTMIQNGPPWDPRSTRLIHDERQRKLLSFGRCVRGVRRYHHPPKVSSRSTRVILPKPPC